MNATIMCVDAGPDLDLRFGCYADAYSDGNCGTSRGIDAIEAGLRACDQDDGQ
jgi:hypothetical protein